MEFPSFLELRRGALVRFGRRDDGLSRVVASQAEVVVIEQHLYLREIAKIGVDALGAHRGGVAHPPGRIASVHNVSPRGSATRVAFLVCCLFSGHECPPAAPTRAGSAHLHLAGVQLQLDAFVLGVGEPNLYNA